MLKAKVFEGCDVCIMAHPALYDLPDPIMVAVSQFKMTFKGLKFKNKISWSCLLSSVSSFSISALRQILFFIEILNLAILA